MDTAELFVTGGGVLLIIFILWFFFGEREDKAAPAGKTNLYACPMHPWITSDDPAATCSICGMKLTR